MFGLKKKKTQLKSVQEFLESENGKSRGDEKRTPDRESSIATIRPLLVPVICLLVILVLIIAAFAEINSLGSAVSQLTSQIKPGEVQELRSRLMELSARLEKSDKNSEQMRNSIARLEGELEAEKAQRLKAEAAAKKPVAVEKKKKETKPRT